MWSVLCLSDLWFLSPSGKQVTSLDSPRAKRRVSLNDVILSVYKSINMDRFHYQWTPYDQNCVQRPKFAKLNGRTSKKCRMFK